VDISASDEIAGNYTSEFIVSSSVVLNAECPAGARPASERSESLYVPRGIEAIMVNERSIHGTQSGRPA